jgi:hypothetical protein
MPSSGTCRISLGFLRQPSTLSYEARAGRAILIVSHIVLAELFFLLRKLQRTDEFIPLVSRLQTSPCYRLEPLVIDDIAQIPNYPEITEMHDRLIAIQTNRLGATLVTKDGNIQASPQVRWIW